MRRHLLGKFVDGGGIACEINLHGLLGNGRQAKRASRRISQAMKWGKSRCQGRENEDKAKLPKK
jgi:hypothetical protein